MALSAPRFGKLVHIDARRLDAAECVASVLLAIAFAHLLDARNVSWAAFLGYAVMRGHVADSLLRGVLRVIGTVIGAALGLLVVPYAAASLPFASVALALVGMATLYGAITGKRAYAWLFVGLTFTMVMLDVLEHPHIAIAEFVRTRILEVVAGTAACVLVSCCSTLTLRRRWPAARMAPAATLGWHPGAFRHAAQGAVALALLPPVGHLLRLPDLAQGAVTIMAVMLLPVAGIGASGLGPVTRRLAHRVAGCAAGALFSGLFLLVAHGTAPLLLLGTAIGVAVGRLIENGRQRITYLGTQFVLAVIVILVPDDYSAAMIAPGLSRLSGIAVGIAILEPVLLLWHLARRRRAVAPGAAEDRQAGAPHGE